MSTTKAVVVEVTSEDIRIGERRRATRCPVRRALRRAGVPAHAVFGGDYMFRAEDAPLMPLPVTVERWIRAYDAGHFVRPFTFKVRVPA